MPGIINMAAQIELERREDGSYIVARTPRGEGTLSSKSVLTHLYLKSMNSSRLTLQLPSPHSSLKNHSRISPHQSSYLFLEEKEKIKL